MEQKVDDMLGMMKNLSMRVEEIEKREHYEDEDDEDYVHEEDEVDNSFVEDYDDIDPSSNYKQTCKSTTKIANPPDILVLPYQLGNVDHHFKPDDDVDGSKWKIGNVKTIKAFLKKIGSRIEQLDATLVPSQRTSQKLKSRDYYMFKKMKHWAFPEDELNLERGKLIYLSAQELDRQWHAKMVTSTEGANSTWHHKHQRLREVMNKMCDCITDHYQGQHDPIDEALQSQLVVHKKEGDLF